MLPKWYRYRTHIEVLGGAQKGKTSFGVYCRRRHTLARNSFASFDYKAGGFKADVAFMARVRPDSPVAILNPSEPDWVLPYNPFLLREGSDLSVHASSRTEVLLKVVSGEQIKDLPTFRRVCNLMTAHLAVSGKPIHAEIRMFDFENRQLWIDAAANMPHQQFREGMLRMANLNQAQWIRDVLSCQNRFDPFVTSDSLRRFTGLPNGVSVSDCFLNGVTLLVNATPSRHLSAEAGRIFLGLLLSDLLQVGLENATNPRPYPVYLDELQEYATPDIASVLDLVLAAGIRITATHHYEGQGQLADERIQQSLEMNAQIKVIFGGLSPELQTKYTKIAFAKELNKRKHKQPRITYITKYEEEDVEDYTERDEEVAVTTHPDGSESITLNPFSTSRRVSTRLRPYQEEVITGYDDHTLEEKTAMQAEAFLLPPQKCMVILPDRTFQLNIPTLRRYLYNSDEVLDFLSNQPNTYSLNEADRLTQISPERSPDAPRSRKKTASALRNGK
jgi:hypothetical protein